MTDEQYREALQRAMTHKQFDARVFERELVATGYMSLDEYIRRWGEGYEKKISSRADASVLTRNPITSTDTAEPKTNAGSSENNG